MNSTIFLLLLFVLSVSGNEYSYLIKYLSKDEYIEYYLDCLHIKIHKRKDAIDPIVYSTGRGYYNESEMNRLNELCNVYFTYVKHTIYFIIFLISFVYTLRLLIHRKIKR